MPFIDRLDGLPMPRDRALDWYMALLLESIDSYQQTTNAFIAKFGFSIQAHQDERVLMDIQQSPNESLEVTISVRMISAPGRRDRTPYCGYHREHGHDTNECRILNAEIEKLIKRGYSKAFIGKGTQRDAMGQNRRSPPSDNRPRIKQEPQEVPRITRHIDNIAGCIAWVAIHETPERIMLVLRSIPLIRQPTLEAR
ncbi:hypothetical protein LIER_06792 [Lithospermum erythrorhizon]|uniref:Retrotransposon gag domain-containing protein n=1 Tax=Lithospermum erythrorhizon TaxID=34254 RepID=A0AAV3P6V7_LITER